MVKYENYFIQCNKDINSIKENESKIMDKIKEANEEIKKIKSNKNEIEKNKENYDIIEK